MNNSSGWSAPGCGRSSAGAGFDEIGLDDLPGDWRRQEALTQRKGEQWRRTGANALLRVPSAIVPLEASPDVNVLINHGRPEVATIAIRGLTPFSLDPLLF